MVDHGNRIERLGQAEVEDFHRAIGTHLHVLGLEIAMDDAVLVRRGERVGNLLRDVHRLVERHRAIRDLLGEGAAFNQLEDERLPVQRVLQAVDVPDVGMVQ